MEILELNSIEKKDLAILYRREFTAEAALRFIGSDPVNKKVFFSIEHLPTGGTKVKASFIDPLDYPLLPALKKLKEHILLLEKQGQLP